ncbi:MAG: SRPBCC family protein [Leptolyngbyaceae cyanobacterium MO_188.B28]|nr:SRPBCC family protein [Leptolyngbyaceae cyanobacterium MO_188.B28]
MKKVIVRAAAVVLPGTFLLVAGYFTLNQCKTDATVSFEQMSELMRTTAPLRASVQIRLETSPDQVFEYISSAKTLPEWMPGLASLTYDHSNAASAGSLGQGSRREMLFGDQAEIEEIVQFDRPYLVAYQILEGVPLRNHLAVMTVEETGDGGSIFTWSQYFDIKRSSVTGWIMPYMVSRFLNNASDNLLRQFDGVMVEACYSPSL